MRKQNGCPKFIVDFRSITKNVNNFYATTNWFKLLGDTKYNLTRYTSIRNEEIIEPVTSRGLQVSIKTILYRLLCQTPTVVVNSTRYSSCHSRIALLIHREVLCSLLYGLIKLYSITIILSIVLCNMCNRNTTSCHRSRCKFNLTASIVPYSPNTQTVRFYTTVHVCFNGYSVTINFYRMLTQMKVTIADVLNKRMTLTFPGLQAIYLTQIILRVIIVCQYYWSF